MAAVVCELKNRPALGMTVWLGRDTCACRNFWIGLPSKFLGRS